MRLSLSCSFCPLSARSEHRLTLFRVAPRPLPVAAQLKRTKFSSNLTNLRFLALHPLLAFDDRQYRQRPDEDVINLSGKMMLLDRLLKGLFARGSKVRQASPPSSGLPSSAVLHALTPPNVMPRPAQVLIFSQFTRMMNLLEDAFDLRGWDYYRIDGANSANQDEIEEFNTSPYHPEGARSRFRRLSSLDEGADPSDRDQIQGSTSSCSRLAQAASASTSSAPTPSSSSTRTSTRRSAFSRPPRPSPHKARHPDSERALPAATCKRWIARTASDRPSPCSCSALCRTGRSSRLCSRQRPRSASSRGSCSVTVRRPSSLPSPRALERELIVPWRNKPRTDSLAGMSKLTRKPTTKAVRGGKKSAKLTVAPATTDELDKKSKQLALERMLKEVWSVEGQKVRLAEGGDEVLSDEQLEQRAFLCLSLSARSVDATADMVCRPSVPPRTQSSTAPTPPCRRTRPSPARRSGPPQRCLRRTRRTRARKEPTRTR